MTTSIEEALRSSAWRLVPVEATLGMLRAGVDYRLSTSLGGDNNWPKDTANLYRIMIYASPDHTPALVALIEGLEADSRDLDRAEVAHGETYENLVAAEAKCDALREALAQVKAAITHEVNSLSIDCTVWMPAGNETLVDFIDRALTQEPTHGE